MIRSFIIYTKGVHALRDTVEEMPWAEGKHPVTWTYAWFLASWAKRLSWKEVAEVFQSTGCML